MAFFFCKASVAPEWSYRELCHSNWRVTGKDSCHHESLLATAQSCCSCQLALGLSMMQPPEKRLKVITSWQIWNVAVANVSSKSELHRESNCFTWNFYISLASSPSTSVVEEGRKHTCPQRWYSSYGAMPSDPKDVGSVLVTTVAF